MPTLQELRKRRYKTIKAFAEAYGCGASKASGILNGLYHMTLSKDEVRHLASILKIGFVECADACDNTFAELKGYKGDDWKKTPRTHKGIWERWRYVDELLKDTEKAARSGDWTEYRKKYASTSDSGPTGNKHKQSSYTSFSQNASSCFTILGVPSTATVEQIKQAFREKAKAMHPDHGGSGNVGLLVKAKEDALKYAGRK